MFGRVRSSTVQVVHPLVSRRHAVLRVDDSGVTLADLGSSNGTWLNGEECTRPMAVSAGDEISLGREGARFRVVGVTHRGADVFGDDDQKTLVAGDPRALRVAARIAVSPDALPHPPEADGDVDEEDEPPTRPVRPGELRGGAPPPSDGARTRSATPDEVGGESLIPVIEEYVSDSEYHDLMEADAVDDEPATVPVGRPPARRPEPEPRTEPAQPPPERPRSTPKTEPVDLPPPGTFEPTQERSDDESIDADEVRSHGFLPGAVVGLLLALLALGAAAVFSRLPETLADLGLQRVDAGGPR